ncbi:hypothetical protein DL93DRAFT_2234103 [Clavulina sp. PMI_390]|nr:hypothetical protein DL93DRAFT_2234103 [Clavulina sp. PMI_390]
MPKPKANNNNTAEESPPSPASNADDGVRKTCSNTRSAATTSAASPDESTASAGATTTRKATCAPNIGPIAPSARSKTKTKAPAVVEPSDDDEDVPSDDEEDLAPQPAPKKTSKAARGSTKQGAAPHGGHGKGGSARSGKAALKVPVIAKKTVPSGNSAPIAHYQKALQLGKLAKPAAKKKNVAATTTAGTTEMPAPSTPTEESDGGEVVNVCFTVENVDDSTIQMFGDCTLFLKLDAKRLASASIVLEQLFERVDLSKADFLSHCLFYHHPKSQQFSNVGRLSSPVVAQVKIYFGMDDQVTHIHLGVKATAPDLNLLSASRESTPAASTVRYQSAAPSDVWSEQSAPKASSTPHSSSPLLPPTPNLPSTSSAAQPSTGLNLRQHALHGIAKYGQGFNWANQSDVLLQTQRVGCAAHYLKDLDDPPCTLKELYVEMLVSQNSVTARIKDRSLQAHVNEYQDAVRLAPDHPSLYNLVYNGEVVPFWTKPWIKHGEEGAPAKGDSGVGDYREYLKAAINKNAPQQEKK